MNSPIAQAEAEVSRTQSPYAQRARYRSGENGFDFAWPEVPLRQFLAERDRAFDAAAPTGLIPPATKLHFHHNHGTQRMRSFVIHDEGLHFYTRTVGFSFD